MAIIIGKDSDNNLIGTHRDDWVFGLGGNDTLSGGDGKDTMFGGKGNDSLVGGSSADLLTGGSGRDHFVYLLATDSPAAAGWDRILDFTQGQDKIDLAAFRNNSSNLDLIWKGEDPADPGPWGVWYHNGPTSTYVYADTSGDGIADLKIELKNTCGLNLVASDFIGVAEAPVNENVVGTPDADLIVTGAGNDTVDGGAGDDAIDAGAGDDEITPGPGDDTVTGGPGADSFFHHGAIDGLDTLLDFNRFEDIGTLYLTGAAGEYTYDPATKALTHAVGGYGFIFGGTSTAPDQVPFDGTETYFSATGDATSPRLGELRSTNTASIAGTMGNDLLLLFGTANGLTASGGDGDDRILDLSAGGNSVAGDGGNDTLDGGAGNDTIKGGAGADSLAGGADTDTLLYVDSPSRVIVNMLNTGSVIVGGDTVLAGTARDGFGTTDTISGFETVVGSGFSDFLQGSTNVANRLEGRAGNDTLVGSGMSDSIPGAIDDTLLGGTGNDELRQTRGADHLDGGDGTDRLAFLNPSGSSTAGITYGGTTGVNVNLEFGTSDYDTSDAGNPLGTLVSIENVTGTTGNDSLVGGDPTHAPDLLGNGVLESFSPLGGNDTITGATGNGFITRADYSTSTSAVTVNLGTGTASDGFGGTDTLVRVDQAFGGSGNDTLLGGSQERSNAGIFLEQFRGGAGNDEINGAGTDTVMGAAGTNQVRYDNSQAAVIVNLGATDFVAGMVTVQGGTARDGFIADTVTGAQFTDTLLNINSVLGSNFNDTLVGGASDHRLIGGPGNDLLVGGTSGVEASYNNGTTAVNVNLATGFVSDGQGGSDTLVNIDDLRGSVFNDTLTGNAANNRILGDPGADTIDGGDGIDFASYLSTSLANGGINAFIENGAGLVNDGFGLGSDTLSNIEGLIGTHSNDTLAGALGDQWFIGRGGSDSIDGGAGSDWVSYIDDPAGVTVNLGAPGSATDGWGGVWALGGTDTLTSIENVEGSQFNDSITGDAFANRLDGRGGNDTIKGGAGADSLVGGADIDTLLYDDSPGRVIVNMFNDQSVAVGGVSVALGTVSDGFGTTDTISGFENVVGSAFNDYIQGTSNVANQLEGGAGNDTLAGSAGGDASPGAMDDTLLGGAGDDVLRQTRGHDSIDGGDGFDRLEFVRNGINYRSVFGVSVNLGAGTSDADAFNGDGVNGPGGDVAAVSGIEHVLGTAGSDSLTGDAWANLLEGGAEDDTLRGGAGDDTIDGGDRNDRIVFSDATGGIGINFTLVQSSSDTVVDLTAVGLGVDTYRNIEGVVGTNFNDSLNGSSIDDRLEGGAGNDTIDGGAGSADRIAFSGAAPINFTLVQSSLDTMVDLSAGGLGIDTYRNIEGVVGSGGNDTLTGSSVNDLLIGAGGSDSINGAEGNDTLRGSSGNDTIDGGAGIDLIDYSDGTAGLTFTIVQSSSDTVVNFTAGRGIDTYRNIEGVIGTDFNDILTGSAGNDVIDGGAGDNDTLRGGAGDDTIDGGAGSADRIVFSDATGAIDFTLVQSSSDTVVNLGAVGLGTDTYRNIEMVIGTSFNDTLTGSSADDRLQGGPGDDTIDGGAGSVDRITFNDATGAIDFTLVQTSSDTLVNLNAVGLGTDTYRNIEGVAGTDFNDTLTGSSSNDFFTGLGGNDSINGAEGDDTLRGSGGNDTIDGGAGIDYLEFSNATAGFVFTLNQGTNPQDPVNGLWSTGALPGGIGSDFYKNMEGVIGTEFIDTLTGSSLADVLQGGGGADTMTGSAGTDTFRFVATSDSSAALSFSDVITDFVHATDKIDLSAIDANTGVDSDQAFAFVALENPNTVANSVTWSEDLANIRTILHIDNDGDTAADMQIVLHGTALGLTDADFIL